MGNNYLSCTFYQVLRSNYHRLKQLSVLAIFILLSASLNAQSIVDQNGRLQVSGNRIVNENGTAVEFAGPSLFWSNNGWGGDKFYNAGVVNWVKEDWKATIIRAAMGVEGGGGYADDPAGNKAKVETVVDAAIAAGMYVIIDFHTHDAPAYWSESISFFTEMAQKYGQNDHVIFEIYNEPLGVSWTNDIKPYAEAVIAAIRQHSQNLVIVGTPNWSQDVDQVIGNAINDSNTAYTIHFYAGTHFGSLRSKGDAALNAGLALFVTEWGTVDASGDGAVNSASTNEWVTWMKANKLSHCNWSINDKAEGASALNPNTGTTGNWSDSDLTSSGSLVKSIVLSYDNGISEPCTTVTFPAVIEAENYCEMSGIQLEPSTEGGENVGYIDAGDWLTYKVNVPSTGAYKISYRVASLEGNGGLDFELAGGATTFGSIAMPNTGGWQNWQTISHDVNLTAGEQTIAISATSGGWNINWFEVTSVINSGQYSLTTLTSGSGSISLNPSGGPYDAGTVVTASAQAASGWHFVNWSGDASGTSSVTSVTMNSNQSITAIFEEDNVNQFSLTTLTSGSGSISLNPSGGSYDPGTVVTASAQAASGWHFVNWSGDASGTSSVTSITMNSNQSITAIFEEDQLGNNCESPTTISLPLTHEAPGEYCWVTNGNISYINSWSADLIEINGVDITNTWVQNMPAKINGNYYIKFIGTVGWSHIDVAGTNSNARVGSHALETVYDSEFTLSPNPATNLIRLSGSSITDQTPVMMYNLLGEKVLSTTLSLSNPTVDISTLTPGVYTLKMNNRIKRVIKQ